MAHENARMCVIWVAGWVVLSVAAHGYGRPADGESDIKKVIVVDPNGAPVSNAKAYRGISFVWDEQAKTARWVATQPLYQANAEGELLLKIARLGNGSVYLIANDSLDLMGSLYVPRRDTGETLTVRVERPGRLKAVFENKDVAMTQPSLSIGFYVPEKSTIFADFITVTYALERGVNQIPLDVPCPSGCHLHLEMNAGGGIRPIKREITPLDPEQVSDLGSVEPSLDVASGFKVFGQDAPELQVAQWVKGEPVTLAELKGKVVLVDFWGLWCGPCVRSLPSLVSLHEKYAKDGLVIIALHDSSLTGESLLDKSQGLVDLSKLPFRVAVDSPREDSAAPGEDRGKGRTIDAYGITWFPANLIIDREGRVVDTRKVKSEDALYSLLYGRPMPRPTTAFGRMFAASRSEFVKMGIVAALILILAIILVSLRLRRSNIRGPKP